MCDEIELVLKPNTTPEELSEIATAITTWHMWATSFSMIREMRLVIKGGPYLTRDEKSRFFRHCLPASLVDDVVIDGRSWNEANGDESPQTDVQEADTAKGDQRMLALKSRRKS